MPILPPRLSDQTAAQWRHFQTAVTETGLTIPRDHTAVEALKTGFALSRFVARTATRHPEIATDLLASGDLTIRYGESDLFQRFQKQLLQSAGPSSVSIYEKVWATIPTSAFEKQLRLFRHREMLRIAVRDLAGIAELSTTLGELSYLADICIQQALEFQFKRQCNEWGTPVDDQGKPQNLVVLGMGKLGAHELNFSSDVDLIFTYPKEGHTVNGTKTTSNEDFFIRLSRKLMKTIGAPTAEGFVFRVDTRLRPFGESGPIALSFSRMEEYYETHGREWERYALIKARVVAGDAGTGRQLLEDLKPFVFRRYLDYNTFESLRDMKKRIALEVQSKGLKDNIKLGPGGIREVEFFGQMFQLLRGGVQPELQARGILTILRRLVKKGYIPPDTGEELSAAYDFLRRTENRIQAYMDQQRHQLPQAEEERTILAASMDFEDWPSYLMALNQHRQSVHHHFNALLEGGGSDEDRRTSREETQANELTAIWQGVVEEDQALAILEAAHFTDPSKAYRLVCDLKGDAALRPMSPMGQERLNKIMPLMLKTAGNTTHPQLVLQRLFNLIKSICRRTAYLSLLYEYPAAITHLVQLSEASPWIADLLSRHPALLDELLDPRTLYSPPLREELIEELQSRLAGIPEDDLEHQLESLRIFKQINVLRVAASDITNVLPLMKVSDRLSDIAEAVLAEVVQISWRHLVAKHGAPT
ncbi:MAG: bifunctional [glutamate--ammonia ligase]-adenylyl-L-tyrosine phosphorylase/[glutamate--ammonia-ligase] adenylyltransferase, partial [Desulfobacteraceae bacterium]